MSKIFVLLILFFSLFQQILPLAAVDLCTCVENWLKGKKDISGKTVSLNYGRPTLILIFDPENGFQRSYLRYSAVVRKVIPPEKLDIIGFSLQNTAKTRYYHQKLGISFPLLAGFNQQSFPPLVFDELCSATILLGPEKKILFKDVNLVNPTDLQLLVEKYIQKPASFKLEEVCPEALFPIGYKFPELNLENTTPGRHQPDRASFKKLTVMTFFSSFCSVCRTGKRVKMLEHLSESISKQGEAVDFRLVFFRPLLREDLSFWEKQIAMPFDKFFADDVIKSENRFYSEQISQFDPFTIIVDENRRVVFSEHLRMSENELIKELYNTLSKESR